MTQITAEELIRRARALVPALKERAERAERELKIPAETIADMQEAGFFRILQPKRYGGYELPPAVFAEVQMTLAEGCMSTAWMYGVVGVHPWQLGLFPDEAQRDVWGDDDSTLVASTYMPVARVTEVEGGYRISGRWSFSTGCENCDWVFLGGNLKPSEGKGDTYRTFLLPKSDYRIERNWDVIGLRGTGSHDIVVEDAFVPVHRTHATNCHDEASHPGRVLNTAPLYRIPFAQMFIPAVSNSCIGALKAACDAFQGFVTPLVGKNMGNRAIEDPNAQLAFAQALAGFDEMRTLRLEHYRRIYAAAEAGNLPDPNTRMQWRYQVTRTAYQAGELTNQLLRSCGGAGTYRKNPLTRIFLDMMTGRAHIANNTDMFGRGMAATLLKGEVTPDPFL
ncbi:acyl-CoA dehydrogenase family protein [Crenobacter intestini]|uniref:Flavin-dependent monooxygenase n=1 Tax=Crenobacter intestini TaxID=2563443 RepID=A0A4T0UM50_9NEIS|nr:acyl-CoA dehydrogenase family protein [Crenobacter intestini]TIC79799.1 flavin-dependent monooxygenase [Crenobacter intestini]